MKLFPASLLTSLHFPCLILGLIFSVEAQFFKHVNCSPCANSCLSKFRNGTSEHGECTANCCTDVKAFWVFVAFSGICSILTVVCCCYWIVECTCGWSSRRPNKAPNPTDIALNDSGPITTQPTDRQTGF